MGIAPHKPGRTVGTNAFNKNKFKGNYEKITDSDLQTTLYIYEPVSMANLPEDTDKFIYQQIFSRFSGGGRVLVSLVPYRERPEIKVEVTSQAGDYTGLERDNILSVISNTVANERPTKRFYCNKDLSKLGLQYNEEIDFEKLGIVIYEENNYVEIINNDATIKQYSLTLEKVTFWEGGSDSYFRDVRFYYENYIWQDTKKFSISSTKKTLSGNIGVRAINNRIEDDVEYDIRRDETTNKWNSYWRERALDNSVVTKNVEVNPNFSVPLVTSNGVKWMFPWVWEYLYAKAQFDGTYQWKAVVGGSNSSSTPDNKILGKHTYDGSAPEYREIKGDTALEVGSSALEFLLPYTIEWGLPRGLSSHAATFMKSDAGTSAAGILGLQNNSSSLNGARPWSVEGPWASDTLIFALDNAYDPSVLTILEKVKVYLSRIEFGAYFHSDRYKELIDETLKGTAIYQGTAFSSDMAILKDIVSKSINDDIRTWKPDNDWNMYLTEDDTITLSNNVAYEVTEGPSFPKIDTGLLDIKGLQLQTNDIRPFNKLFTSEDYWDQETSFGFQGITQYGGIGEIQWNVYTKGQIVVSIWDSEGRTFTLRTDSDIVEGRSLSGGVRYAFL